MDLHLLGLLSSTFYHACKWGPELEPIQKGATSRAAAYTFQGPVSVMEKSLENIVIAHIEILQLA